MASGDLFKLNLQYEVDKTICIMSLCYKQSTSAADTHPTVDLAVAWEALMRPLIQAAVTTDFQFSGLFVYGMHPTNILPAFYKFDEGVTTGTHLGQTIPANVSLVLKLRTLSPSGRHNGRIYLSGMPEDVFNGNDLDATYQSTYIDPILAGLTTDVGGAINNYQLCVAERFSAGVPVVPPIGNRVTAASVSLRVSGLRRRTAKARYFE